MKKNVLDEIIESSNKDIEEQEDEFLSPLLEEINLIKNEDIKTFVRSVLLKSKMFWNVPSSFPENIIHLMSIILAETFYTPKEL